MALIKELLPSLPSLVAVGWNILLALGLWFAGRWLIGAAVRMSRSAMNLRKLDPTAVRYLSSSLSVVLTLALVVAMLGHFGVQTTSFAALFAGVGVAIGVAWAGLLSHFAAGLFLLAFRPFKVGDDVMAGGVAGRVIEIGLFGTTLNTVDNIWTVVGNNRIFSDTIQNFSTNRWRFVTIKVEIDATHDPDQAMESLLRTVRLLQNVLSDPPPNAEIVEVRAGTIIAVSAACANQNYVSVLTALNRAIRSMLIDQKYGAPVPSVGHI